MGQKTHPKGFRLVTTQKHLSSWYSSKKNYPELARQDFQIREHTIKKLDDFLNIAHIEISRIPQEDEKKEFVTIFVHALYPREKDMIRKISTYFDTIKNLNSKLQTSSFDFKTVKEKIKKYTTIILKRKSRSLLNLLRTLDYHKDKIYTLKFEFIKNQFENAALIAKFIGQQLEKRVPFRRAVKQAIKKVQGTEIKGIKIELSGRLNGIEIARSEWKREGKIPLHTLRASIDYTLHQAETIYGIIGIKVWLFTN